MIQLMIVLYASLAGPLIAGLISVFGGNRKGSNSIVQAIFAISSALGLIFSASVLFGFLRGTLEPLGAFFLGPLSFALDWSVFFLILINLGTFLASLFALGYVPKYIKTYSFPMLNASSAIFILGMQLTVLANTVFGFLLFWELMSVGAYFLVIADREEASLKAGLIYFVMTHLGMACILAGFLILAQGDIAATFDTLREGASKLPATYSALAFFLLLAGFGSKAGLVPLHQWLPYAHPQAPSHSSALMSGVMLKVALYGFLRVALNIFPTVPLWWAGIVVVIGLLSAFFGVLSASVEADLKRLLAWCSIENLGLIFAMVGMGMAMRSLNLDGEIFFIVALLHALNHTVFKSGLFLASGAIISEIHTRDLDSMGGLARPWPIFSMAFLGLVFAAIALPPFGTFYGEWLFLQSLASSISAVSSTMGFLIGLVISITALVGGLAIFTFAKTFASIFLARPRSEHASHVKPLAISMVLPVCLATIFSALIGFFSTPLFNYLSLMSGSEIDKFETFMPLKASEGSISPALIFVIAIVLLAVAFLFRKIFTSTRPVRVTDTWDCGQPITPRMEYTATGFAAPIRFFFRSVLKSERAISSEALTPANQWMRRRNIDLNVKSIWESWIYAPITRIVSALAQKIIRLQNGVIQFYILLILATLAIVLIFAV